MIPSQFRARSSLRLQRRAQAVAEELVEGVLGRVVEADARLFEQRLVGRGLGAFGEQRRLERLHEHRDDRFRRVRQAPGDAVERRFARPRLWRDAAAARR